MNKSVFISHSSKDNTIAEAIYQYLVNQGISCWIDLHDIRPGIPYAREIMRGLNECNIVVVVYSHHVNFSEDILNEVDHAHTARKRIIPFLLDNTPFSDELSYYLKRRQWITAFDDYHNHLTDLCEALGVNIHTNKKVLSKLHKIFSKVSDKEGYCNGKGEIVITPQWGLATPFNEGLAMVTKERFAQHNQFTYIDESGQIVMPWMSGGSIGTLSSGFHEGLATKPLNGKWGFIDKTGKEVISCQWGNAHAFSEGLAAVKDDSGKWGFIDKYGNISIPCRWNNIFARVRKRPDGIEGCVGFSEGFAGVQDEKGNWFIIDKSGKIIIDKVSGLEIRGSLGFSLGFFSEGLAFMSSNNKYGFFNRNGILVIPLKWNSVSIFKEGLCAVHGDKGKWGYITKNGTLIIPDKWKEANVFSEGLAMVMDETGKCGYIDKNGQIVIPCQWPIAGDFENETAWVKVDETWRLIDKTGTYCE